MLLLPSVNLISISWCCYMASSNPHSLQISISSFLCIKTFSMDLRLFFLYFIYSTHDER